MKQYFVNYNTILASGKIIHLIQTLFEPISA